MSSETKMILLIKKQIFKRTAYSEEKWRKHTHLFFKDLSDYVNTSKIFIFAGLRSGLPSSSAIGTRVSVRTPLLEDDRESCV
jgi:hypothetical protein